MKNNEIKKILEIGIPSTIAWGGHILYNIVDNIMVGKILGTESLAIAGIAGAVYFIFLVLGMGSSNILTALFSEALAEKNQRKIIETLQNGLLVSLLIGIALFTILFFGGGKMIEVLNKQTDLNGKIISYMKIMAFGNLPVMIFFAFERLCEGLNRAKISMYTVLICNVSNIVLNYAFLTGSLGLPNLGVNGAALATILNNCLEVIIIITLTKRDAILREALRFKAAYFSKKIMIKVAYLGIPGGLLFFLEGTAFNVANFIASKSSIYDVAGHQLLMWTVNGFLTPIFGFSTAITARIAFNMQLKREKVAFKIGVFGFGVGAFYIFTAMLFLFIFKFEILSLMLKGDESDLITMNIVAGTLLMIILIEIFDATQLVGSAILRGFKDTQVPVFFALISYWGFCIPLSYFFGIVNKMGLYGIWLGIGCGLFVNASLIISRFYLKYGKYRR